MAGLGEALSIAAAVGAAYKTSAVAWNYISTVRHAPARVSAIKDSLKSCRSQLKWLRQVHSTGMPDANTYDYEPSDSLLETLAGFERKGNELARLLKPYANAHGTRMPLWKELHWKLSWPFTQRNFNAVLSDLKSQKDDLNLILSSDINQDTRELRINAQELIIMVKRLRGGSSISDEDERELKYTMQRFLLEKKASYEQMSLAQSAAASPVSFGHPTSSFAQYPNIANAFEVPQPELSQHQDEIGVTEPRQQATTSMRHRKSTRSLHEIHHRARSSADFAPGSTEGPLPAEPSGRRMSRQEDLAQQHPLDDSIATNAEPPYLRFQSRMQSTADNVRRPAQPQYRFYVDGEGRRIARPAQFAATHVLAPTQLLGEVRSEPSLINRSYGMDEERTREFISGYLVRLDSKVAAVHHSLSAGNMLPTHHGPDDVGYDEDFHRWPDRTHSRLMDTCPRSSAYADVDLYDVNRDRTGSHERHFGPPDAPIYREQVDLSLPGGQLSPRTTETSDHAWPPSKQYVVRSNVESTRRRGGEPSRRSDAPIRARSIIPVHRDDQTTMSSQTRDSVRPDRSISRTTGKEVREEQIAAPLQPTSTNHTVSSHRTHSKGRPVADEMTSRQLQRQASEQRHLAERRRRRQTSKELLRDSTRAALRSSTVR